MKKLTSFAVALVLMLGLFAPVTAQAAYQPSFSIQSQAVYLENIDTGQAILERNADARLFPGYLTKVMTALVVLDYLKDTGKSLDQETATLKLYIQDIVYGSANLANIYNGDELSIRDLLYAMMLQSANEAALMLADYVGDGSLGHFTEMMNDKALELGCTDTNFTDAAGFYDADTYTTARDFSKIAAAAMKHPAFVEIVNAGTHEMTVVNKGRSITIYNYTNGLIRQNGDYYLASASGIMSSALAQSGKCMASQASSGGYTYQVVVLGAPITGADGKPTTPEQLHFHESRELYKWAFEHFSVRSIVEKGELVTECPVKYSLAGDHVKLETGGRFSALMENSQKVSDIIYVPDIPEFISAPVEKGQQVGTLRLMLADEEIGSVPLLATEGLAASKFLMSMGWFSNILHTFWAKFVVVLAVVLVIIYILLFMNANRKRKKKKHKNLYSGGSGKNRYL